MLNRIDVVFEKLKKENKKALIPFITAGYPTIEKTGEIFFEIEKSGADIIEIGIPYSDPLADGPVVEDASLKAIVNGFKLAKVFELVKDIRKSSNTPIVFMVYFNTLLGYGIDKFIDSCKEIDIDGLIIPDLPFEESGEVSERLAGTNIYLISLVALTSKDRISKIVENAKGFVYCVSSMGVTGARKDFDSRVYDFLNDVREKSSIPIAVGFGISNKEDVEKFKDFADGAIVGSALINRISDTDCNLLEIGKFIKELK